eukprot:GEMP01100849.1.p1 GENE.GEMP01100849.1~~GEMP01100849.1.p1  ORF type:complete len:175 (+),score=1.58 GEMP01100849.1:48-527(+)
MWVLPVLTFINYDCRYTPEKVVPWDYWRSTALYGGAQASLNYAHKAAVEHREDAIEECPLGLLFSDVIYATMCFRQNDSDCYQRADEHVREGLRKTSFRILMATEWPMYDSRYFLFVHSTFPKCNLSSLPTSEQKRTSRHTDSTSYHRSHMRICNYTFL